VHPRIRRHEHPSRPQTSCITASNPAIRPACFTRLEIVAAPRSNEVEIKLQNGAMVLQFRMHRDAGAQADQPVKRQKVR
jgi:hypothetical protein